MLIGYARVSTLDQNPDLQRNALEKAECERIYKEAASGKKRDRPALEQAIENLREGDTLIVWKLDRLGRSVKDLIDLVSELEKRGVNFRSLTEAIDTSTPAGRFFFHVMASLAQMERELMLERTRAGMEVARKQGRKPGIKPKMTPAKQKAAQTLLDGGATHQEVAASIGVSIPTLYRWIPAAK